MPKDVPSAIGKRVRLGRILKNGRAVIFAFDHGFEHGPKDFPRGMVDPREVVRRAVDAKFDAIMLTKGIAEATWDLWASRVPLILKVTGKTSLRPPEMQLFQYRIGSVGDAVALGADGVAGTVYWGAPQEGDMAKDYATIVGECDAQGLPTMILAYPRGPAIGNPSDPEIVRYAARASAELGADLIKTHYTGSTDSFREVVRASPVPVLMSGGVKEERALDFLKTAGSVMDAGGAGVVVGRNVFQSNNPVLLGRALRAIVHDGSTPEMAAKMLED